MSDRDLIADGRPKAWPADLRWCACAAHEDNWRGHGLTATYVCVCNDGSKPDA